MSLVPLTKEITLSSYSKHPNISFSSSTWKKNCPQFPKHSTAMIWRMLHLLCNTFWWQSWRKWKAVCKVWLIRGSVSKIFGTNMNKILWFRHQIFGDTWPYCNRWWSSFPKSNKTHLFTPKYVKDSPITSPIAVKSSCIMDSKLIKYKLGKSLASKSSKQW